ncbi:MAG: ion channel [Bdellovibrionota bacterium]
MRIQDRSKNKFVQKKSKIGLVAIACFVVVHWIACFWALLNPKEGGDILEGYIEATYWTITTLTTVGYGDITPQNNIARFFTMFVMVTGVGFYGLVIGQFSRIMLDSDKRKAEENEKLEALTSLLTRYEIPANIQDQAFQFYQHVLSKQAGQEEIKVMKDLPKALQAELQIYMNIKLLNNVALFQNVSHVCLKAIAKNLKQVYFSPSEKIINNGEIGDEMFIIGHGKVSVHDGSHHIATLASGQCFGEMALMGDAIRKADVTSISYCDLFVLTKEIFSNLLDEFDDLRKNVEEIALSRKRENEHHSKTQKKNVG